MYSRAAAEGLPDQYRGLRESTDDPQRPIRTLREYLRNYTDAQTPPMRDTELYLRLHNWGENKASFLLADLYAVSIQTPSSVVLTVPRQVGHSGAVSRHTSIAAPSPCALPSARCLTRLMAIGRTVVV